MATTPTETARLAPRPEPRAAWLLRSFYGALTYLAPIADLAVRLWVANVFWKAGVSKFESFSTTIQLFKYEYSVPLLSPEFAAYVATFSELFFPVLLVLGLGGRLAALALFGFNIVAVISYPGLTEVGREQHVVWGILLLVTIAHGPGKLSLDYLIGRGLIRIAGLVAVGSRPRVLLGRHPEPHLGDARLGVGVRDLP